MKFYITLKLMTCFMLLLVAFVNCGNPLSGSTPIFKNIDLTVNNFISNCKAGNAITGTGVSDVNYMATITVTYNQNGNGTTYVTDNTYLVPAPTGDNKSTFLKSIRIPTNKTFRIKVRVDASECSICNVGACPLIEQMVNGVIYYAVNKPLWEVEGQWATHPADTRTMSPTPKPRSIPVACACQVKK